LGTQLLNSTSSNKEVSVTAATKEDGSLTLMIVNRSSDVKTMPLSIKGFTASGAAAVWLLDKDHKAVSVDSQDLSDGKVTLPAESVTLYIAPSSK
jgi:glycosyl hydrolase family 30